MQLGAGEGRLNTESRMESYGQCEHRWVGGRGGSEHGQGGGLGDRGEYFGPFIGRAQDWIFLGWHCAQTEVQRGECRDFEE